MTTRLWPRSLIRHGLYPSLLLTVAAAAAWLAPGRSEAQVVAGVLGPVLILLWVLERASPFTATWRPEWRVFALDGFYTFVSSPLAARLTRLALVAGLAAATSGVTPRGVWPHGWSPWLQVPLAVVVADLPLYVAHRWMHETDLGWRIHLVHHSPTKLHLLASARSHPLNVAAKLVTETGTLLLLGAPPEVMTVWFCLMTTNGLLQHANVDMRTGPLSWVLATPEVHRIHHDATWAPSNFGSTTTLWDRLFGSYRPPERLEPRPVGVSGSRVPETYLDHLRVPFESS